MGSKDLPASPLTTTRPVKLVNTYFSVEQKPWLLVDYIKTVSSFHHTPREATWDFWENFKDDILKSTNTFLRGKWWELTAEADTGNNRKRFGTSQLADQG